MHVDQAASKLGNAIKEMVIGWVGNLLRPVRGFQQQAEELR
jgi:hypothetical protein